ncbi:transforming acidic coiled-coil protein isoform X2 [Haematobia irritans]|uniref:transforming acidic coiled-coil protein isoform X2 n=1 Tax=Haematobia irritans TaxID=7368 RepID=UPI003F4FBD40
MDYISNLIKRPLSLVAGETPSVTDKTQISTSLPITLNVNGKDCLENELKDQEQNDIIEKAIELHEDQQQHHPQSPPKQDKDQNNKFEVTSETNNSQVEGEQNPQALAEESQERNSTRENSFELNCPLTSQEERKRPLSLSSSFNGNFTDFIGVSNKLLEELDEFLPPPPPLLSSSVLLSPIEENSNQQSKTPTPPPPPLSPAMMASQTIDELLSEISDNLTLAGINDEVLAIASPPNYNKAEHSPLSTSKSSLNNSKSLTPSSSQAHILKTPTNNLQAAGTAATTPAVFEANSTLHKFHVDPELATGLFDDHHSAANDSENSAAVNKSSNKFVGLTEFDEANIPELPCELNPNIEEQYNVTFEECFIPTLNASTKVSKEQVMEHPHHLIPNEGDNTSMSSTNDTFADCQDEVVGEKDPLGSTYAEHPTLNTTTDIEGYESAIHEEYKDVIADVSMDADPHENLGDHTQVIEEILPTENNQQPLDFADEPMDVDMSVTMDMIQDSSEKIQNVEKVLQHAENMLQHLGEKSPQPEDGIKKGEDKQEFTSLIKPIETSKMTLVINAANTTNDMGDPLQHLEMEQSNHDVSLNKSIELPTKKTKTMSSECVITAVNNETQEARQPDTSYTESTPQNVTINNMNSSVSSDILINNPAPTMIPMENINLSMNNMNSSSNSASINSAVDPLMDRTNRSDINGETLATTMDNNMSTIEINTNISNDVSNKSLEGKPESNLNVTTSLSTSTNSLKSSAPNSPTFPTKQRSPNSYFPKAEASEASNKPRFLEKSDYIVEMENRKRLEETKCGKFVEPEVIKKTSDFVTSNKVDRNAIPQNKRQTFNVQSETTENKRLTFNVQTEDPKAEMEISDTLESLPTTEGHLKSRRTFNVSTEEHEEQTVPVDTSYTPMEVDHNLSRNSTLPISDKQDPVAATIQQSDMLNEISQSQVATKNENITSNSPPLPTQVNNRSNSPPLPTQANDRSNSPPLPTMANNRSNSPPLPTMQKRTQSPTLPTTMQEKLQISLPLSSDKIKIEKQSPPLSNSNVSDSSPPISLPPTIPQKRPSIRGYGRDILSAKEQSNIGIKDEKDEYVEMSTPSPMEEVFTTVSATSTTLTNTSGFSAFDQNSSEMSNNEGHQFEDDEFHGNSNLILNPSDFDYLLTKGNNNTPVDRSSLLLKFDPLLGVPVPVNQGQQGQQQQQLHLQIPTNLNNNPCLSPTIEEDEHNESTNRSFVVDNARTTSSYLVGGRETSTAAGSAISSSAKLLKERSQEVKQQFSQQQQHSQQIKRQLPQLGHKKNATMSVDVIKDMSLDNNDCNKTFENSNSTQPDDKQINYKMDELEKKVKNEVLKTEDIEKKLKEAEQREEALIKRITEKDKTVAKMNGVIEAYEKAIAELIAEKEQLIQNYEKQMAEVKADRDSNYHHLTSLETTFSDLHVKYEKSKEMTCQLKGNEESLIAENRKNAENLRLQEQRYDKMKNHAMQQLEIANKKLETLTREHTMEITKLKALLKKEEIARSSMSEQLAQKSKENAELVKICDELISGQGS